MCGIVGRFNLDNAPVDLAAIKRMCDAIVHRGPDDEGQFVAGPIGLGMRRLSIIDLSGGHQPMQTEDGTLTVVFNGEIYNYPELKHDLEARGHHFRTSSDTESILYAYREFGEAFLERLNGMFAIALWDAPRRRLLLARDRLGIKPLYLHQTPGAVAFASEIKALLVDPAVSRTLDRDALAYFLRYGYVGSPATLLQSIRKLPAAHYMTIDDRGVTVRRYWNFEYTAATGLSDDEHAARVYDTLKRAVTRQLLSDVPLGAFLSGGLDSSSIVSLMAEVTGRQVSTYSIGFAGADAFHSELTDAEVVAQKYATNHHQILVDRDVTSHIESLVSHLDEPLADSSFVVTYLVSKLAVQTVKVILSGVGGDELFGGYRRYLGPRLTPTYQRLPRPVRRGLAAVATRLPVDRGSTLRNYARLGRSFVLAQDLPPFEQYDAAVRMMNEDTLARLSPGVPGTQTDLDAARRDAFERLGGSDPINRMMRLDLETSLSESLLLLTDKMTMAASLEGRVPFLDHELVELAARVPTSLKIKGTTLRYVQREAMRGHVPDEVMRKRKRGFGFPIGAWFRRDLRELAGDAFSPAHIARQGVFDGQAVQTMLREHEAQRQDYSDALLALLTFSIWFDQAKVA